MTTKECAKCKRTKSADSFYKDVRNSDGLYSHCKPCYNENIKRKSHAKNWEKTSAAKKLYRERPEIKESRRQLAKTYYDTNPIHREVKKIRRMLSGVYTGGRSVAESTFVDAIGCTRKEFVLYINERLTDNMTPENYNKVWNFDHTVPYGMCDTIEEVYIYSHYTNVQPMLKLDNARKKNTKIG